MHIGKLAERTGLSLRSANEETPGKFAGCLEKAVTSGQKWHAAWCRRMSLSNGLVAKAGRTGHSFPPVTAASAAERRSGQSCR